MEPEPTSADPIITKRWWQRPMVYVIGGLVVLAVAGGVAWSFLRPILGGGQSKSLYYERPGYDRAQIGPGIGDAQALVLKAGSGQPVMYQGTAIVQACSVLTMENVRGVGLKTKAYQLSGSFERKFFDGQGKGVLAPYDYSLETDSDDSNSCDYGLEGGGRLTAEVFQLPYAKASALNAEISCRFQATEAVSGLHAYKRTDDANNSYYLLTSSNTAVQVYFNRMPADKVSPILSLVASNLNQQLQHASGPPTVSYDSPLLKRPYAMACDLLEASDVAALFGAEASPVVAQASAGSVGVLSFGEDDASSDNYIINECRRHPVRTQADIISLTTKSIRLKAQTFMQLEAAQHDMAFNQHFYAHAQLVEGIGDEALFTPGQAAGDALHVRKGRVVLELTLGLPRQPQLTNEQKLTKLKSAAGPMVERLTTGG